MYNHYNLLIFNHILHILSSIKIFDVYLIIAKVTAEDILEYAKKLSQYTSAPPHFNPAMPPSMAVFRPYPDESRMRMGLLFRQREEENFEEGMFD